MLLPIALHLCTAAKEHVWELVEPGNLLDAPYTDRRPSVRYGSDAVQLGSSMIVSHGYFFDHRSSTPTWLNDTWMFNFRTEKWRQLRAKNRGPSPRYKHALFAYSGAVYLVGGDDGGHPRSHTHVWGAHFNDVWRFDLQTRLWNEVKQSGSRPSPRQGHTATVWGDRVIVFGGMVAEQESTLDSRYLSDISELWVLDMQTLSWARVEQTGSWPPGRRVHVAGLLNGFVAVHGGFSRHSEARNLGDTWLLDLQTLSRGLSEGWRGAGTLWLNGVQSGTSPSIRGAHAGAADSDLGVLWIYGGAVCKLGCTCLSDTWRYRLGPRRWEQVVPNRGSIPVRRHFHTAALDPATHAMYVTGGESYGPYGYWNDVWRMSLLGAKPTEAYVDRALVYDGIKVHSVMGNSRATEAELEALRPPAAREHDRVQRGGRRWDADFSGGEAAGGAVEAEAEDGDGLSPSSAMLGFVCLVGLAGLARQLAARPQPQQRPPDQPDAECVRSAAAPSAVRRPAAVPCKAGMISL